MNSLLKYIGVCAIALALSSCAELKSDPSLDALSQANADLEDRLIQRTQDLDLLMSGMELVQSNLRDITKRENLLVGMVIDDVELTAAPQEIIMGDLALLDGLIQSSHERIDELEALAKRNSGAQSKLQKMVANLKLDLLEREKSILTFKQVLSDAEESYALLLDEYNEQWLINTMQDGAIHQAYFAFGSKTELVEQAVMEKKGGVLGLGATWQLKADFNKDYFTEVDTRELAQIPVESSKVELISTHPADTYEWVKEEEQFKELRITDPERFWSSSKYLAMVVD